ncbi:hypothetical protein Tco_0379846, partial [Tanacetum coccineum]
PGQMTYPVASLTLDSARSYVMQGAPFTQRMISSIPIGGSISPESFLLSILLLVVIIVMVVIVAVILVVFVVTIIGVVIVTPPNYQSIMETEGVLLHDYHTSKQYRTTSI